MRMKKMKKKMKMTTNTVFLTPLALSALPPPTARSIYVLSKEGPNPYNTATTATTNYSASSTLLNCPPLLPPLPLPRPPVGGCALLLLAPSFSFSHLVLNFSTILPNLSFSLTSFSFSPLASANSLSSVLILTSRSSSSSSASLFSLSLSLSFSHSNSPAAAAAAAARPSANSASSGSS